MNAPKSVEALSGLTPLEKKLLAALKDIRSWAIDERAALREQEIRAISALIAKAEATATEALHAGRWRTIESAPRDGTEVLLFWPIHNRSEAAISIWGGADFDHSTWRSPSHWMPLSAAPPVPAPPSSEREGSRAGERS